MIRRPPRSTLFPTRRSSDLKEVFLRGPESSASTRRGRYQQVCRMALLTRNANELMLGAAKQDRKSTRLNSSHVSISYAVFCLKKKTKIRPLMFMTDTYRRPL